MLVTFDSVGAFVDKNPAPGTRTKYSYVSDRGDGSWTGNQSFAQSMQMARLGDNSRVKDAEKIIDRLNCTLPETQGVQTVRSPFGGRVDMSDWLTGSPTPMRRRVKRDHDVAPIKIVASITCSAAIDAETVAARGSAILAFLMAVQKTRPVELYVLLELHGVTDGWHYSLIKIDSKPLNISQASYVLCSAGFFRHGFNMADLDGFSGAWPTDYHTPHYDARRRERLGLGPNDIVIKEAHFENPLVRDPEKWITNELQKIRNATVTE